MLDLANPYLNQKYNASGIYSISVNNLIVYIGQSKNMLNRIYDHFLYIEGIKEPIHQKKLYTTLQLCLEQSCSIKFDVVEYCPVKNLDYIEKKYIKKFKPLLNTQFNPCKFNIRNISPERIANFIMTT